MRAFRIFGWFMFVSLSALGVWAACIGCPWWCVAMYSGSGLVWLPSVKTGI